MLQVCWKISALNEQYLNLVTKYKHEMALRKKLHNQVVDLKGNIRVFCRIRPVIPEDGGPGKKLNILCLSNTLKVHLIGTNDVNILVCVHCMCTYKFIYMYYVTPADYF